MSSKTVFSIYNYNDYPSASSGVGDVGTTYFDGSSIAPTAGMEQNYPGSTDKLPGDTKVFAFSYGGIHYVLVAATAWDSTTKTSVCKYMIYQDTSGAAANTGSSNWTLVYGPSTWTAVVGSGTVTIANLYKIVISDNYLIGIDYDARTVFRATISVSGSVMTLTFDAGFTFAVPTVPSTTAQAFGVDVAVFNSKVYALFNSGYDLYTSGNYNPSTIVELNMSLVHQAHVGPYGSETGYDTTVGKNGFSIQGYGDYLVLVAIGGLQQAGSWNPSSCVQKIALSNLAVTSLLIADTAGGTNADDQYDFRGLTFSKNGNSAFILTGHYNSAYTGMVWNLYYTNMTALLNANTGSGPILITNLIAGPIDSSSPSADNGFLWALLYSENTGDTWFARGNALLMYSSAAQVGSTVGIASLTTLTATNAYLNAISLYQGETAAALRGYVAPAFASNTAAAREERERFLKKLKDGK